jgi:hypothetical protein
MQRKRSAAARGVLWCSLFVLRMRHLSVVNYTFAVLGLLKFVQNHCSIIAA